MKNVSIGGGRTKPAKTKRRRIQVFGDKRTMVRARKISVTCVCTVAGGILEKEKAEKIGRKRKDEG